MDMHYCDIFTDCYHCPVPFCPYEKLDDRTESGWAIDDEVETDDEEIEEEDMFEFELGLDELNISERELKADV